MVIYKAFSYPEIDSGANYTPQEEAFYSKIASFCEGKDIHIEKRSQNYLSVIIERNDFIYFKLTDRTKWFKLRVALDKRNDYIDSPLFSEDKDKKKKVMMWKVSFSDISELEPYKQIIQESCKDW